MATKPRTGESQEKAQSFILSSVSSVSSVLMGLWSLICEMDESQDL